MGAAALAMTATRGSAVATDVVVAAAVATVVAVRQAIPTECSATAPNSLVVGTHYEVHYQIAVPLH